LDYLPTLMFVKEARGIYSGGKNIFNFPMANLFEKELNEFLSAVQDGSPHRNSVSDSIRVLQIIEDLRAGFRTRFPKEQT